MPENEEVVVEVLLTPADIYKAYLWSWPSLFRLLATVILGLAVYDVCLAPTAPVRELADGQAISEVLLTVAAFIFLGLHLFPYLRLRSTLQKTPGFRNSRKFTFSAAGVRTESADATSDEKWSLFVRIGETENLFFFLMTPSAARYVPKRCFASAKDVVLLRKLIRENFKGKWRLRRDA